MEEEGEEDEAKAREQALQSLCAANGIREEEMRCPEKVTQIEMVLDDYCCMGSLRYFPNLQSVVLIQQAISKLEGLDECPHLERLLLNENRIEKIEGLAKCTKLKTLCLCTNVIEEIGDSLNGLHELTVLWIAENRLKSLAGLNKAPNLRELNAARNQLTSVAGSFDKNQRLVTVNLADNQIGSFKDILGFAHLPSLQDLAFSDPDWGENPLCLLCNYKTYLLYHLPFLHTLDRMRLGDDERQAAEVAFSNKRLYYNMRTKRVRRLAADALREAKLLDEERVNALLAQYETLARVLKGVEAASEVDRNPSQILQLGLPDVEDQRSIAVVKEKAEEVQEMLKELSILWTDLQRAIAAERARSIETLMLELRSGGNVRMEVGNLEKDTWARSIADLFGNRCHLADFAPFGIKKVQIRQVLRLHHRNAQLRFDSLVDKANGDAAPRIDYLFYVPEPGHAEDDLHRAVTRGFADEDMSQDVPAGEADDGCDDGTPAVEDAPILLTNSVSVAEIPRLAHRARTEAGMAAARALLRGRRRKAEGLTAVQSGSILICSTCLGHERQDPRGGMFEYSQDDIHTSMQSTPSSPSDAPASAAAASTVFHSLYRVKAQDERQRVWKLPGADFVVPEYIVHFDYGLQPEEGEGGSTNKRKTGQSDLGPFTQLLSEFKSLTSADASAEIGDVNMLPVVQHQLKPAQLEKFDWEQLTLPAAQLLAGPADAIAESLLVLNLHGRGLSRIDPAALQRLSRIESIHLSFNNLESVACVTDLPTLTSLDVSFNLVQKIDAMVGLPLLRKLNAGWNSLQDPLEVLEVLARDVPSIEELYLHRSFKAVLSHHREVAVGKLPQLQLLEGSVISEEERAEAVQDKRDSHPIRLTDELMVKRSYVATPGGHAASGRSLPWSQRGYLVQSEIAKGNLSSSTWRGLVFQLDLSELALPQLMGLGSFPRLRRLRLDSNRLSSLVPLSACMHLEELSVEDNELVDLSGLEGLSGLQHLDAGQNRIADPSVLHRLTSLRHVGLEDNYLDSLDIFATMTGLMELYLSSNLIEDQRSILMLKQLPKLSILDLAGNSLCSVVDYRSYTIFHLKRLRVLDGNVITQAEMQESDEKLSGKLTIEMLEERLGLAPASYTIRNVSLANLSLRELGQHLNEDVFPGLRELNLDGNPFTDIKGVGPLSKLMALRMNRTRIDIAKGMLAESSGIASLPNLQVLELGSCGITDMAPLANFPLHALRVLHLPGNEITKVDGLSHFEQLRELVLDRNKIKQFDEGSFQGLKALRELRVEDNCLKSLGNLTPLTRLRSLYLSLNRVAELSELEKLTPLRQLLLLQLGQNPIARKPFYRANVIHAVQSIKVIDGKEVTDEEREKSEQLHASVEAGRVGEGGLVYVFSQPVQGQPANPMPEGLGLARNPTTGMLTKGAAHDDIAASRYEHGVGAAPTVVRPPLVTMTSRPQATPVGMVMMGQGLSEEAKPRAPR